MVSFTDHSNAISIERLPTKKQKFEKVHDILKILFYVSLNLLSLLKAQKNNHSSASDRWEYTKSRFKENARTFSKSSTTQGNIRISKLK